MSSIRRIVSRIKENPLSARMSQAISYGVGGAIGSRILILLSGIFVSRFLGSSDYGKYSLVHTTVLTFVSFSGLGIASTLTRYVVLYKEDRERLGKVVRTLIAFCYAMSVIVSLFVVLFSGTISLWISGTKELSIYFQFAAVSVLFSSLASVQQSILIGFEKFKVNAFVQFARCGLFLVLSIIFTRMFGLTGAIVAIISADAFLYLLSIAINHKIYVEHGIKLQFSLDKEIKTIVWKFTLPAFIASILYSPTLWLGNAMLTKYSGYEEMAVYSISHQWLTILTYIPAQFGNMRPIYTDLFKNGQYNQLWRTVSRITLVSSALILPLILGGVIFGQSILGLYGNDYASGYRTFALMLVAAAIINFQAQIGAVLQAIGKMWAGFVLNLVWSIVFLTGVYLLRNYGSYGYALAFSVSYLLHAVNSIVLIILSLTRGEKNDD